MREQLQYHLYKRFQVLEKIGEGNYGLVFKVIDRKTNQVCALKKIFDAFQNKIDSQRTYRQVKYLNEVSHPHIVKLLDVIPAKNQNDLYILFQYIQYDIEKVLRICTIAPIQRKFIVRQLLQALCYLHQSQISHRDIKPSNVLIDKNCNLKLCDFGLTRSTLSASTNPEIPLTSYIATRSYRPPEVVLLQQNYGTSVDIWGVGCILGEMILKKPVFVADNTNNLLDKILELVERPKKSEMREYFTEEAQERVWKNKTSKKISFYQKFSTGTDDEIQFIMLLLEFVPQKRISAKEALKHKYFKQLEPVKEQYSQIITIREDCLEESSCRKEIELISNRFRECQKSTISFSGIPYPNKYVDTTSKSKIQSQLFLPQNKIPKAINKSKSKKLNKSKSTIIAPDKSRSKLLDSYLFQSRKTSKHKELSKVKSTSSKINKSRSKQKQKQQKSQSKPKSKPKSQSKIVSGGDTASTIQFSKLQKQKSKISTIKKKSSVEIDKKAFYSQKILKDHLLQYLRK